MVKGGEALGGDFKIKSEIETSGRCELEKRKSTVAGRDSKKNRWYDYPWRYA